MLYVLMYYVPNIEYNVPFHVSQDALLIEALLAAAAGKTPLCTNHIKLKLICFMASNALF